MFSLSASNAVDVEKTHGSEPILSHQNDIIIAPTYIKLTTEDNSPKPGKKDLSPPTRHETKFKVSGPLKKQMKTILSQSHITNFDASGYKITDADLLLITEKQLGLRKVILLNSSDITNKGLKNFSSLHDLEILDFSGTRVNSDGLEFVLALKNLKEIKLHNIILSKDFLDKLLAKNGLKVSYDPQNVMS